MSSMTLRPTTPLFASTALALALSGCVGAPPSVRTAAAPRVILPPPPLPTPMPDVATVARVQPANALVRPSPDPIGTAIASWSALNQTDGYPFASYARFLLDHRGFPNERTLRTRAERSLAMGGDDPRLAAAYFDAFPPLTGTGEARRALALFATGQREAATASAALAWTKGGLSAEDEVALSQALPGALSPTVQAARVDTLLWSGRTDQAMAALPYVSADRVGLFGTRAALQRNDANGALLIETAPALYRTDPGFVRDAAEWLRRNGQPGRAQELFARRVDFAQPPADPEAWMTTAVALGRGALADGNPAQAYEIARRLDDLYPTGTDISDLSFGERDEYTNLAWLGGQAALKQLSRPREAAALFDKYGAAAQSGQTRSKGFYWAGVALARAGDRAGAEAHWRDAARYPTSFYGLLAQEELGAVAPPPAANMALTPADLATRQGAALPQAIRYLGQSGQWDQQGLFLRAYAAAAETPADFAYGHRLAAEVGRPDLNVMLARNALGEELPGQLRLGFPTVNPPPGYDGLRTITNAITRQESQFDPRAQSRVGATGLMQLMPATAQEQAGKLGIGYDRGALTQPDYNIQLGTTYFERLLTRFGGSYPLAVAAYNGGGGNVNKWLRANGDPRTGEVDMLDWMEAIPFSETKGYVQRVLENATVYDLLDPARANMPGERKLSGYLGRR